jgi:hypothetical protein
MHPLIIEELAHIAEQEQMNAAILSRTARAARRRRWVGSLRHGLARAVGLTGGPVSGSATQTPPQPAILLSRTRREAR